MSKKTEPARPEARLPKGLSDISAGEIRATEEMLGVIRRVFEAYGFEPLDTPAIEYSDALGKFLPDQDRPNEGVFSFKDDDRQWLSLRYDLTAPLARYVAENYQRLPKPFRRYQAGPVWRNEKPGPGRFRQFVQFDADTVGASSVAADAELCMLAADTLEALGIPRGQYVVKVNDRKILDRILERWDVKSESQRLAAMRAIDKFDRLGTEGMRALLGKGRKDESGDYTPGAGLTPAATDGIVDFVTAPATPVGLDSPDLDEIERLVAAAGYDDGRIVRDCSIVRGLEYYTGPVFEAELLAPIADERGTPIRLGSVVSGGRYDGLIERFTGEKVPATGVSIGISRLLFGLKRLGEDRQSETQGPVIVLVLDRDRIADYQAMTQELRSAGIRAELYLGDGGLKAQMKYADRRGAPCVR